MAVRRTLPFVQGQWPTTTVEPDGRGVFRVPTRPDSGLDEEVVPLNMVVDLESVKIRTQDWTVVLTSDWWAASRTR